MNYVDSALLPRYARGVTRLAATLALMLTLVALSTMAIAQSSITNGPILNVTPFATDPAPCQAGQIWYNTTSSAYKICPAGTAALIGSGSGSGTTNPAIQFSIPYYSASGSASILDGLAAPTTPNSVPQFLTSTPSGGVGAAPLWGLAGVPVDAQSSATPSVGATDRASLLNTTNNTTSTALSVPQAGTTNFANNFPFVHCNTGTVVATDTPATSTINGNATLKLLGQVAGNNPECAFWWNDNSNYIGAEILPTDASGRLQAAGMPALTGAVTNTAGALATSPGKIDVTNANGFCSDAGANDTYTCNLSPAITAYVTGTHYRFKANTANTGAATINFNSVGALTIKKAVGGVTTDLADNDIRAGQWVDTVYDGTNMQMQSVLGNAAAGGSGAGVAASNGVGLIMTGTDFSPMFGTYSSVITSEANSQVAYATAITVSQLQVVLGTATGGGQTLAITLRKNGADTAVTCTIGNSSTTCTDTTHSVTTVAADLLDWKVVLNSTTLTSNLSIGAQIGSAVQTYSGNTTVAASVSGALTVGHTVKTDASGNLVDVAAPFSTLTFSDSGSVAANSTRFFGVGIGSATEASSMPQIWSNAGTASKYTCDVRIAPGSGQSDTFTLRVNSASPGSGPTCTISNTNTKCTQDTTNTAVIAVNDLLGSQIVTSTTAASTGGQTCAIQITNY